MDAQSILVAILVIITGYYAYQTHKQANLLEKQWRVMSEQRRRSIQPLLQIDSISYWYRHLEEIKEKQPLVPGLEMKVSNVGSGPALNLSISADATIDFEYPKEGRVVYCKLYFSLLEHPYDVYLERGKEPQTFRLNLIQSQVAEVRVLNAPLTERILHVKFDYRDIDGLLLSDDKSISLGDEYRFLVDERNIMPSDSDFPFEHLTVY